MEFWKKFLALCESVDMTPNGVAKEIGISSATITTWKNGRRPTDASLNKICEYFNIGINYFYDSSINLTNSKIENSTILNNNIDPAKVSNAQLTDEYAKDDYEKELLAIFRCLSIKEKNALLNKAYELSELFK